MAEFTKKDLEYLAALARIKLEEAEETRLLGDLRNILAHVAELNEADTQGVVPMNGGTLLSDILREDEERHNTLLGKGKETFPTTHDNQLEIPSVLNK